LAALRQRLVDTYLSFDPRSLGLCRILLGIALLVDLWLRFLGVDVWFTDEGLLPSQAMGPPGPFSLFLYASTRGQALAGMALAAVVYLLFTVGFMTRLFHILSLSLVAVISLTNRMFVLENGGHYVLKVLVIWSVFLPLGRRLSIDALRSARGARAGRVPAVADGRPVVSLAVLALLLQLAVIYLFNVIQKTGPAWRDGSAVHYVLHDERMNTAVAVWIREHLPELALRGLTWATLALEAAAVILVLSPVATRHLRLLAVVLLPALHAGFAVCLVLGVFSWAMIAFFPLLLAPAHWAWIERRLRLARATTPAIPAGGRLPALRVVAIALREAAVLVLIVAAAADLTKNPAFPARLRLTPPAVLEALVRYPRALQFWRMFTPEPHRQVRALSVEARTVDGRTVDPYNEVASRIPALPRLTDPRPLPVRLGQDQPFSDYTSRLPQEPYAWLRRPLIAWILRYPERTGDPADAIETFQVYLLTMDMPPPGSTVPGRTRYRRVLTYP
jgi:hypothetical protein